MGPVHEADGKKLIYREDKEAQISRHLTWLGSLNFSAIDSLVHVIFVNFAEISLQYFPILISTQ